MFFWGFFYPLPPTPGSGGLSVPSPASGGLLRVVARQVVAFDPLLDPPQLVVGPSGVGEGLTDAGEVVELAAVHRLTNPALDHRFVRVVEEARQLKRVLDAFPTHYPRHILEQTAIAGGFVPGAVDADLQGVADKVAQRLDLIALEYERGWQGRITQDRGFRLARILRGVEEVRTLDGPMLRSGEARKTGSFTQSLQAVYDKPAQLVRKDHKQMIHGPLDLLAAILEEGERGLTYQRYKGLGEMNPDQLWETTLDPDARTLLQVKVDDMAEADDLFTKLMGDVVEPRREFIQQNALSVENLDF